MRASVPFVWAGDTWARLERGRRESEREAESEEEEDGYLCERAREQLTRRLKCADVRLRVCGRTGARQGQGVRAELRPDGSRARSPLTSLVWTQ